MADPILVTGAPGNVGSSVVERLKEDGHPVRVAAWDMTAARTALGEGVEYLPFDFENPATFGPALAGVRRLFLVRPPHLADVPRHFHPFLDACKAAGVEQVVLLSVMGAERIGVLPHAKIERRIQELGLGYTFLRPAFFMQNLSTTYRQMIRESGEIAIPAGRARMSWIDARDIGLAAAVCLTQPGHLNRCYTLTEEAYRFDQIADIFSEALSRPVRYPNPSFFRYRRLMHQYNTPAAIINLTTMMYILARLGLSHETTPDLGRLLGRTPRSMATFARDHAHLWAPGGQ